jgi:hypothetical protein
MRIHECIGENHCKFANAIQEIAEELSTQLKDTDKGRKSVCERLNLLLIKITALFLMKLVIWQLKETSQRHERAIQETEQAMEKVL